MKDFAPALGAGRKLIERYPNAAAPVRRSAWLVVAHSSLELADYPNAEQAYGQVLALTSRGRRVARRAGREPRRLDLQAG